MVVEKELRKILVVDDERSILNSIEDLLEDDFTVLKETRATDALLRLEEEREVSVILSDQRMPDMGGDQFLAAAQKRSQATRLLITGYADLEALVRAVNEGRIYGYISKPWNPEALRLTIFKADAYFRIQRELDEEQRLLRALMDNIPDPISFKDAELRFTRINRARAHLLGVDGPPEVLGCKEEEFGEYPARADEERTVRTGELLLGLVERMRDRWYSTSRVPVRDREGNITALVAISRDITEFKRLEERLKDQVRELARSNAELEQFAYAASHDLQEPLRSLRSYLQLLERRCGEQLDEEGRRFIERAVDGAERMRQLIEDLLAYSRVGSQSSEAKRVESSQVWDQVVKNMAMSIESSGARVERGALPEVRADEVLLEQLFHNLIDNALKFRRQGEFPRVRAEARRHGDKWQFRVQDNGIGIEAQFHERIFRIFQRLHTRQEYPGTGVGLALCRRIVERHGGRIWVESEPGRGATFCFTLGAMGGSS